MTREEALKVAKPILFNTEMVWAIQNGRKTATRRLIKLPYYIDNEDVCRKSGLAMHVGTNATDGMPYPDSPYKIGDILYVRETWAKVSDWIDIDPEVGIPDGIIYKSDWKDGEESPKWHPSIHMPKEAARIFLRVTDVRVERLQDIDDDGVVAEGLEIGADYERLWNSTIKKADLDKYGYDADPVVFVYGFELLEVTE